jgi:putative ABC transport system ATP-binding protein
MLELKAANVIFHPGGALERHALKNLNLSIKDGDFVTIVGGNGAGKSTLMNVISGDITLQSGQILIDQKDITKLPTFKRSSYIARVFQDPLLGSFDALSIEENLGLAMKRGGDRSLKLAIRDSYREKFRTQLKTLGNGLYERLSQPMQSLSGGQRQSVSLLMATLIPSRILLLDEHTAALDPVMAKLVMKLTEDIIQEQAITSLMITHSMHDALKYGNRLLIMKDGELQHDFKQEDKQKLTPADLVELIEG